MCVGDKVLSTLDAIIRLLHISHDKDKPLSAPKTQLASMLISIVVPYKLPLSTKLDWKRMSIGRLGPLEDPCEPQSRMWVHCRDGLEILGGTYVSMRTNAIEFCPLPIRRHRASNRLVALTRQPTCKLGNLSSLSDSLNFCRQRIGDKSSVFTYVLWTSKAMSPPLYADQCDTLQVTRYLDSSQTVLSVAQAWRSLHCILS